MFLRSVLADLEKQIDRDATRDCRAGDAGSGEAHGSDVADRHETRQGPAACEPCVSAPSCAYRHARARSRLTTTSAKDLVTFSAVETVDDKAVVFLPWNTIEPEAQQQILNTASRGWQSLH